MESKILLIIIFVLVVAVLFLGWQAMSLHNIRKYLKEDKQHPPDEHYYELKFRMQFLVFAGVLLIAFAGTLGYTTIMDVKYEIMAEMSKEVNDFSDTITMNLAQGVNDGMKDAFDQIDSLIEIRIDNTNQAFETYYKSVRKELSSYNEQVSNFYGYSKMYVISDYRFPHNDTPNWIISYKNLGMKDINTLPTIFITKKNDFDFKISNIGERDFQLEISNAKQDTIAISLLIFTTD